MKSLFFLILILLISLNVYANGGISVHVLDTQTGTPGAGIKVKLEKKDDAGKWILLAEKSTNAKGRIDSLTATNTKFGPGVYQVIFETQDFFAKKDQDTFFTDIPVEFKVANPEQHYHIPLLLSPFAYSTYRGN
jgi:5-hydroxyisourate hydrolase